MPSPWCHAKQSASSRPEEDGEAFELPCEAKPHTCQTFMPIRSLQASPCFYSISAFREWLGGPPQAARCAFMRLISLGFRSLRAILRS